MRYEGIAPTTNPAFPTHDVAIRLIQLNMVGTIYANRKYCKQIISNSEGRLPVIEGISIHLPKKDGESTFEAGCVIFNEDDGNMILSETSDESSFKYIIDPLWNMLHNRYRDVANIDEGIHKRIFDVNRKQRICVEATYYSYQGAIVLDVWYRTTKIAMIVVNI